MEIAGIEWNWLCDTAPTVRAAPQLAGSTMEPSGFR